MYSSLGVPMISKFLIASFLLATSVTATSAATVFNVTSDPLDQTGTAVGPFLGPDDPGGVAQVFTLTEALSDVSFGIDLFCGSCSGQLMLISGLMAPGAFPSDYAVRPVADFTGAAGADAALSGLDLVAGQYTLMMSITGGGAIWYGTDTPVFSGSGVSLADEYLVLTELSDVYLPRSPTSSVSGEVLKFSISGTKIGDSGGDPVAAVPLPASAPLMLAAIAAIGLIRRRRH